MCRGFSDLAARNWVNDQGYYTILSRATCSFEKSSSFLAFADSKGNVDADIINTLRLSFDAKFSSLGALL